MSSWYHFTFQQPASLSMEMTDCFHDYSILILLFVIGVFSVMLYSSLNSVYYSVSYEDHDMVEAIWTLIPAFILVALAIPSLILLYQAEESVLATLTMIVMGHQWYWEYSLPELSSDSWDSYMLSLDDLNSGTRNLDVDNRCWVPLSETCRVLVSSADVLHSWSVSSLGVKLDAVPGRLNQIILQSDVTGLYYGQCSEICGANHSFMPIVIEVGPWFKI